MRIWLRYLEAFEKNNNLKTPMYGPNGEGYDSLHSVYINTNLSRIDNLCFIEHYQT